MIAFFFQLVYMLYQSTEAQTSIDIFVLSTPEADSRADYSKNQVRKASDHCKCEHNGPRT